MHQRDDTYEYSLDHIHDEEHGKIVRKKIYQITIALTLLTLAEVMMGVFVKHGDTMSWHIVKWMFISMTVVKASLIVWYFMHMRDETLDFKDIILWFYIVFIIDLTIVLLHEGFVYGTVLHGFYGIWE